MAIQPDVVRSAPQVERRNWARYPSEAEIFCQAAGDDIAWSARVMDVSRGGLQLACRRRFEAGTLLKLVVEVGTLSLPTARAIWVVPQSNGSWVMGCAFLTTLTPEQLGALRSV